MNNNISPPQPQRVEAAKVLTGPTVTLPADFDKKAFIEDVRNAVFAAKIISYAQVGAAGEEA